EVVGYDATKKTYTDTSFDSSGASFAGTVTLNGNVWTFAGTSSMGGKSFQSRCALTMATPATSFTVKCDSSPDGSKWTPTFEGQWKKATS
ncbi:MAG TPA: hypothetical protein VEK56_15770, partial [Vicinamibacterales bacterium]|nr:hypothetical protein [Vicinamibacterales bacterium]